MKKRIENKVYRSASHLIALSDAFARRLHQYFEIPADRIRVIPGGVDIARFAAVPSRVEARGLLSWPQDRPILIAVRRLVKRMGLSVFIDAISQLRARHPDLLVHLCGNGELKDALSEKVVGLGLQRHVKLLGYIPESQLPLVYRAADFSVVPSIEYEGFGLAAAESLASGTPSLVTEVDGLPEVMRGLDESLIVQPNSADEIADRLDQFLAGRLRAPSDTECRAYADQRFGWPRVVQQILNVYAEALGRPIERDRMSRTETRVLENVRVG